MLCRYQEDIQLSASREFLKLFTDPWVFCKITELMTGLYSGSESVLKREERIYDFYSVNLEVRRMCPCSNTCMDWVLNKGYQSRC